MLALPPELTHRQARATLQQLLAALAAATGDEACVDARALRVFDSSALAVLLECRRTALAAGRRFAVQGLPPGLAGMAGLYGVQDLVSIQG
jgi:phospholipid transport system transporter-binding protein